MKFPNSLNPEKNLVLRAILYCVGTFGSLHLIIGFILAIIRPDGNLINPASVIILDQLFPALSFNWFNMIAGWVLFAAAVTFVYRHISKSHK